MSFRSGERFLVTADELASDFLEVAKLAGVELPPGAVSIEKLPAPHLPPTRLPTGLMAVYVFARGSEVLKVGKVGAKSQARYASQHYNAGSALSTLAASILAESGRYGLADGDIARAGQWIGENLDRVNFLIDGSKRAIVTSANLTEAALNRNHEFGLVSDDEEIISACSLYFADLWKRSGADLTAPQLDQWDETVTRHRMEGGRLNRPIGLGDFGADAGVVERPLTVLPIVVADAPQAFVKFFGQGSDRAPLSLLTIDQIARSGCHWVCLTPRASVPRACATAR